MTPSLRFWSCRLFSLLALQLLRHTDISLETRYASLTILTPFLLVLAPFASVESVISVAFGIHYLPMSL